MANLLFPLQFKRQYAGPLDIDSVFETTADRTAYLTSPLRYAGQLAFDKELSLFYYMSADLTTWVEMATAALVDITKSAYDALVAAGTLDAAKRYVVYDDNDRNLIVNVKGNSITDWVSGTTYKVGEYVYYKGDILKCVTENTDTDFTVENWENLTICRNQFVMANVYSDLADVIFDGDCLIYIKEDEENDYGLGDDPVLYEGGLYVYNSDDDSITSITASASTDNTTGSGDDLTQEDFENMFG